MSLFRSRHERPKPGRAYPHPFVSGRLSLYVTALVAALLFACGQSVPTLEPTSSPAPASEVPLRTAPVSTATPNPVPVATPTPRPTATTDVVKEPQFTSAPTPAPFEAVLVPTPEGGATEQWHSAVDLFHRAVALQYQGRLAQAVETYQRSIATYPTAEAHTFLGWTYSWMGENDRAISEAERAIDLDPDYGNPYNDIGVALIEMGQLDAAIPWLEKAIAARRYEPRHFPHLNLGIIWVRKGIWIDALAAFEEALRVTPEQPLPRVPVIPVPVPLGFDTAKPREETVDDLREAIAGYFEAWNAYDPVALMQGADPYSVEMVRALLLHLARDKIEGSTIRFVDMDIMYFSEPIAILGTRLQVDGRSSLVPYLLALRDGAWKVVGPAIIQPEPRR